MSNFGFYLDYYNFKIELTVIDYDLLPWEPYSENIFKVKDFEEAVRIVNDFGGKAEDINIPKINLQDYTTPNLTYKPFADLF